MKKLLLLALLPTLFIACKKEKIKELPVNKMYLVEYRFNHPTPPETEWKFYVNGISEIDKLCNIKTTRYNPRTEKYHSLMFTLSDSIKNRISGIIKQYPRDTSFVFRGNEEHDINKYKGYYYFIWAERDYNKPLLIDLYLPDRLTDEWKFVAKNVYENYSDGYTGLKINDTKSFRQYVSRFERSLPDGHITRPPAVRWTEQNSVVYDNEESEEEEY
ncbi:hypothetical protein [Prevotella sp. 10(H)]|uniref:hypothetical protein n=1 Tax=Prevotella sp. 10(H) TaxID=1158294 RepID=UPI0004A6D1EF|nr:hypothetical protein [Prevotella sp. 10(H)]